MDQDTVVFHHDGLLRAMKLPPLVVLVRHGRRERHADQRVSRLPLRRIGRLLECSDPEDGSLRITRELLDELAQVGQLGVFVSDAAGDLAGQFGQMRSGWPCGVSGLLPEEHVSDQLTGDVEDLVSHHAPGAVTPDCVIHLLHLGHVVHLRGLVSQIWIDSMHTRLNVNGLLHLRLAPPPIGSQIQPNLILNRGVHELEPWLSPLSLNQVSRKC